MQAPINVQLTQPTLWTSGDLLSSHFLAARLRHCCERLRWATLTCPIKVHIATYITNRRKHRFSIIFIRNHILLVKNQEGLCKPVADLVLLYLVVIYIHIYTNSFSCTPLPSHHEQSINYTDAEPTFFYQCFCVHEFSSAFERR